VYFVLEICSSTACSHSPKYLACAWFQTSKFTFFTTCSPLKIFPLQGCSSSLLAIAYYAKKCGILESSQPGKKSGSEFSEPGKKSGSEFSMLGKKSGSEFSMLGKKSGSEFSQPRKKIWI
jgi:hypothetical protein